MDAEVIISPLAWIALPALGAMVVWTVVTAWRILRPEQPLVLDASERRRRRAAQGEVVEVGFREIHDEVVSHARRIEMPGCMDRPPVRPERCATELWQRRN